MAVQLNKPPWRDMASSCIHEWQRYPHDSSERNLSRYSLRKTYPQKPSPSKVHIVLDFLGQDFRSGDVATVFVGRSLRWFLLGTAWMLLVPSQVDVSRQILQNVRELLWVHAAEDAPVRTGDGDHHPIIGLRDL